MRRQNCSCPYTMAAELYKNGDFKPEDFGFSLNELITNEYLLQQALKAGFTATRKTRQHSRRLIHHSI